MAMSQHFQTALNLRKSFQVINKDILHWFPGHMGKGMRQMQQKLKTIDCIIEVHDARIPFSGRNPNFQESLSIRPHILVLNKKDLTDSAQNPRVMELLKQQNIEHVIYTNCKDDRCPGVKKIFPLMQELVKKSDRFNRAALSEYQAMIIGVPNVGKSSLLNKLRNRNLKKGSASAVGGVAGVTRSVLTRIKVCEDPLVFVLDTPGILEPSVRNIEMGLKLALCSALQDHLVGEDIIADYLLYWLNKYNKHSYVKYLGLPEPSDDITEVLTLAAINLKKFKIVKLYDGSKREQPDVIAAAKIFTKAFRSGDLGRLFLDRDIINTVHENNEQIFNHPIDTQQTI